MENEIRYFSMFTGVGGFELGLERANDLSERERTQQGGNEIDLPNDKQKLFPTKQFTCIGCSETDKYSNELLKQKFPSVKNWGDCTTINPSELPDFDMLCGGFPCQAFSIAGKRKGFKDTRGTLFFDIARIVKVKRPKTLLLENVKGLLNHEKGDTFRAIIQTLSELGYNVQWMVLNSKFFGVPQNRERVFIIGSLRGESRPEILPFGESNQNINEEFVQGIPTSQSLRAGYYKGAQGTHLAVHNIYGGFGEEPRFSETSPTIRTAKGGGHLPCIATLTPCREKRQMGRRFKDDGEPSFTLTGQDIHGVSDGMKIRRLTPLECERLQGFPDGWTEGFSDTQRYKMMGNAVTVNVVEAIASMLTETKTK